MKSCACILRSGGRVIIADLILVTFYASVRRDVAGGWHYIFVLSVRSSVRPEHDVLNSTEPIFSKRTSLMHCWVVDERFRC